MIPKPCLDAVLQLVVTMLVGRGTAFTNFQKTKLYMRRRWVNTVKRQRSSWNGPSADSQLCSRHFEDDYFITERVRFRDEMEIPIVKRLKPDAVPTIFAKSVDYL